MLSLLPEPDRASSPVTGVVLLIGITIIFAMLVLLLCLGFHLPSADSSVPAVFRIATITFIQDSEGINVRGYVTVTNTRSDNYRNRFLKVITYVNGTQTNCNIPTLNNQLFCTLNHNGVWHLYGVGTWGNKDSPTSVWPGHSDISIEYKKGVLHPGDCITLEVIDTTTNRIISRDTYPHTTTRDIQWFMNYFLNPQAA
ncbi:MAG: type IV pilin [Methanoregulaceae archaeon]|nr:MAG: type IV pilin [Methanoregulaceae archaeon]